MEPTSILYLNLGITLIRLITELSTHQRHIIFLQLYERSPTAYERYKIAIMTNPCIAAVHDYTDDFIKSTQYRK